jgi:chromosomal replication initiator protein
VLNHPIDQLWTQVQGELKRKLGAQAYEIWIRPIQVSQATGEQVHPDRVHLRVPNRYYRDWVQANYARDLESELEQAMGRHVTVEFEVAAAPDPDEDGSLDGELAPASEAREALQVGHQIPGIAPDKTFENFVVGACNQFAHAAAIAVAESPGEPQYNPLFIYGSTGLGKTHLLHAIGNKTRQQDPAAHVLYVTAEQFTNEMISAIRYHRMPEFRDKYRKHPTILLMDDVQFLSGKDRTQEELFHTFEWLKERGRQIVFTADVLPREIKMFEPRLRTRCEGGMLADTQPPDMETMMAILRQKAEDLGLPIPDELAEYVSARVRGNIRELEGVLNRLKALTRFHNELLDVEFARRHLGSVLSEEPNRPTADSVVQSVASFYNIKITDLKGQRRLKQLVRPRHVAMYLVRKYTELSFPEIGRAFGNRDHATVQHACKKIKTELQKDVDLRTAVQALERNLAG